MWAETVVASHLGVVCGHFDCGKYNLPTEHPHIPHLPVFKNASGFQYSHDLQNCNLYWNVCVSTFWNPLPAQPPMAEAKFFAFCNKSASGIVGLVIFIPVTLLRITIESATIN